MTPFPLSREAARPTDEAAFLRLAADAPAREITSALLGAPGLEIVFDSFKDGRGFTLARRLREGLGYSGRLRAAGQVLPDQVPHLQAVGFDEVLLPPDATPEPWVRYRDRQGAYYHYTTSAGATIAERRRGAALETAKLRLEAQPAEAMLEDALTRLWPGQGALLSSFGAEAAITLHMISRIDPTVPVLFVDTGKLFPETLAYARILTTRLGLKTLTRLPPSARVLAAQDPAGDLWKKDPDACCNLRKVAPLAGAAKEYALLVTGRKRSHGEGRAELPALEYDGQYRLNPLWNWSEQDVAAYFAAHDLPPHPLVAEGYRSLGCAPCTAPAQGGCVRSGRWAGTEKTECGIHRPQALKVSSI